MINRNSVIAIIPARGGSKGLPGKNIKELCGKPLIAWSIEAGLSSKYIDEVVVTTDSPEIANVARYHGASIPFLRPPELATDTATSFDVVKHTIDFYKNELKREFNYVLLLEPTSPLRDKLDIDGSLTLLSSNVHATAVVGVCKTESQNPEFLIKISTEGFLVGYANIDIKVSRRQDIADVFFLEGSIYLSQTNVLLNKKTFYHSNTLCFEVPKWKSLEIDDIEDFVMVEALMKFKGYL